tara:strand:- start:183 stop:449 length:267 start_codon:yes stop_codon:yes gene_type:complete
MDIDSDPRGHWCIFYCKTGDQTNWKVMRRQNADGVLVSASTYDEVFKFVKYKAAFDFARSLVFPDGTYDATVKRVNKGRETSFYLAGC